jgi:hypothetical protein
LQKIFFPLVAKKTHGNLSRQVQQLEAGYPHQSICRQSAQGGKHRCSHSRTDARIVDLVTGTTEY